MYIFPKGLTHIFGPKIAIFPTSFVRQHKNKKFKKSKNYHFSKGVNQWFWSENCHFSTFFLLGNIGQENVFYNILAQKNAFIGYKKKEGQKVEKLIFFKRGQPLDLVLKWLFFQLFFFRQY